jgi:hypothetical protein
MPFTRHSGFAFSPVSIQRNAPPVHGVYGISNAREWVFVGRADDIQSALLNHQRESGTDISSHGATGFTFEVCDPARSPERHRRLVAEYRPVCNPGPH